MASCCRRAVSLAEAAHGRLRGVNRRRLRGPDPHGALARAGPPTLTAHPTVSTPHAPPGPGPTAHSSFSQQMRHSGQNQSVPMPQTPCPHRGPGGSWNTAVIPAVVTGSQGLFQGLSRALAFLLDGNFPLTPAQRLRLCLGVRARG